MQMKLIEHPDRFKEGTRIIMLKGRYKDGLEVQQTKLRITHSVKEFESAVEELALIAISGERLYVTASSRDVAKAARLFKHRQLDASYDDDPNEFYVKLQDRWVSCLMNEKSQADKLWLFDCDNKDELAHARQLLDHRYTLNRDPESVLEPYFYPSKSATGTHILVQPFHHGNALGHGPAIRLINKNPLMLWGY